MTRPVLVVVSLMALLVGCDDKKDEKAAPAASASAVPAATAKASAAPAVSASAAPSAAPSASATAAPAEAAAPAKDAMVTVKDPEAEPKKTVQALPGGSVTLYLPEWPGTKWAVTSAGKELGKPKEETIPGFAGPKVMAKQLKWETTNPAIKAGQTYVVVVSNTKKGEAKADKTFTLTIEMK